MAKSRQRLGGVADGVLKRVAGRDAAGHGGNAGAGAGVPVPVDERDLTHMVFLGHQRASCRLTP